MKKFYFLFIIRNKNIQATQALYLALRLMDMKICHKLQMMYEMLYIINSYKHNDDVNHFDVMFNKFIILKSVQKLRIVPK
jgi:hypothetical protein